MFVFNDKKRLAANVVIRILLELHRLGKIFVLTMEVRHS